MEILIESTMYEQLGGIGDPEVRDILNHFVETLPNRMFALDHAIKQRDTRELLMRLHTLKGTANSCGFVGIGGVAHAWHDAPDLFSCRLLSQLQLVVQQTIAAWRLLTKDLDIDRE